MTEYIYKLDIPPVVEMMSLDAVDKVFTGKKAPIHKSFSAKEILRPEWHSFLGIEWKDFILFYKPDFLGVVHADDNIRVRGKNEECVWGINFIHGGTGFMEYWEPEDMDVLERRADTVGTYNIHCETSKPPRKKYKTDPGAYLVNASQIHRVQGIGNRYALVLRPYNTKIWTWPELVLHFSQFITKI